MFAKKVFVQVEWKTQCVDEKQIWDRIAGDLYTPDLRDAFGKIAQSSRKPRGQKKDGNCGCENKIPENQPVLTFEVSVGLLSLTPRDAVEPCLRRCSRIDWFCIDHGRRRPVAGIVDPGSRFKRANVLRDCRRGMLCRALLRRSRWQNYCGRNNEQDYDRELRRHALIISQNLKRSSASVILATSRSSIQATRFACDEIDSTRLTQASNKLD